MSKSKKQKAKEIQGYNPNPMQKVCGNCVHFQIDEYYNGFKKTVEEDIQCGLGRFTVKKSATCNFWKQKE